MNLLDRLVVAVSPAHGLRRAQARAALSLLPRMTATQRQTLSRYYDAARPSRATYGWLASFTDANAEIWGGLASLRARSRELERDNPHVRKAMSSLTNHLVGTGILPRAKTGDAALDKKANTAFQEWNQRADAEGHFNSFGIQRLAVHSMIQGGDTLIRFVPRASSSGLKVPLQLQSLEGDFIDHNKNEVTASGRIIQGVELVNGVRRAYWLFDEHPGEMMTTRRGQLVSKPHPADSFVHLYEKERPGQQRGVPWGYAAMITAREIGTYKEAELLRKRLEACFAAIVINPEAIADPATGDVSVTPQITDLAGNKAEAIEPGMMYYARGGSDIKFPQPTALPGYAEHMREELHTLAAGWLLTYELLSGDLSRVNYSSIKAGLIDFRRMISTVQWLTIIPVMCDPIWRRFIDFAVAAGQLPADTPYTVDFAPPRLESPDPLKDNTADLLALRTLMKTTPEVITERGNDVDESIAEQVAFNAKADAAGLVLDGDGRKTARQTGQVQPSLPPDANDASGASADGAGEDVARQLVYEASLAVLTRAGLNGSAEGLARQLAAEIDLS